MQIGLIAPPWIPVPPVRYGGTEVVVDNLARSLQDLGHDVRLFTVGESTCPVPRDYLYSTAVEPMGTSVEEAAHVLAAYEALADTDVIHDHTTLGPLLGAEASFRPPLVTTQHSAFTPENRRIFSRIADSVAIVAISHDQASRAPEVPITRVIHHGIDLEMYRPGPGRGGYLLFVGRMSPDKGVAAAVRIAHAAGWPIALAVKMRDAAERRYFSQTVQPLLRPEDELLVEPDPRTRVNLYQGAAALLNPISWEEPFGLVMAEALATGTPVLAYSRGAAPEIVNDGETGFLCESELDMVAAVARVSTIGRGACRAAAELRFSRQRMARDYEDLYRRLLDREPSDDFSFDRMNRGNRSLVAQSL